MNNNQKDEFNLQIRKILKVIFIHINQLKQSLQAGALKTQIINLVEKQYSLRVMRYGILIKPKSNPMK